MKVLITNDDGVYAPGLAALHQALAARHQVKVVAPDTEQSAVGHAITLADPIRVRRLGPRTGFDGWAVMGTPADCVKLALNEFYPNQFDLVVSGINLGANVGVNILYSGTVSAATEAATQGLRAVAFSLATLRDPDFSFAASFAAWMLDHLEGLEVPETVPLNVNVPPIPAAKIKGVRFTRQSQARLKESFVKRSDPRGHDYYWLGGESMGIEGSLDFDFPALRAGYVTITPLLHDMTHHEVLRGLAARELGLPGED